MFSNIRFKELVEFLTMDVHPFMEALALPSVGVAVNDNATNDNEVSSDPASIIEVA